MLQKALHSFHHSPLDKNPLPWFVILSKNIVAREKISRSRPHVSRNSDDLSSLEIIGTTLLKRSLSMDARDGIRFHFIPLYGSPFRLQSHENRFFCISTSFLSSRFITTTRSIYASAFNAIGIQPVVVGVIKGVVLETLKVVAGVPGFHGKLAQLPHQP